MSRHPHHHRPVGERVGADRIAAELSVPGRRFTVSTHRKPDGDAAGSMIGLTRILRGLGHDVVMWHVEGPGLPDHLAWLLEPGEEVLGGDLPDHADRIDHRMAWRNTMLASAVDHNPTTKGVACLVTNFCGYCFVLNGFA